ncbi:MAG: trigger factor [Candidatus Hydrogenedentes bacterium]|nr:trigger factor [Candidatus Hydrogenedentota bacterium]
MSDDKEKQEPTQDAAIEAVAEEAAATEDKKKESKEEEKEFQFVEPPVFSVEHKGDCAYEVKVTIPAANRAKKAEEVFEELQRDADVPGFRRGRVPRKVLEKKFGKAIREDVVDKLAAAAFFKLLKDEELKAMAYPDIDGLDEAKALGPEMPLDLVFKFEVMPRVTLGEYKGVPVERPVVTVEDADIEASVLDLRRRFALYETVADAQAADGDQVIIDFHGQVDGQDFPGNRAENYPYILGTKRFFPEFEEVLRGAATGATVECDVTFSENDRARELAGKAAHYTIKVNEIKRRQVPELTDEFARQAGYESAADLRDKVADGLRSGSSAQSDQVAEQVAVAKIVESSSFEIPASLLESLAKDHYDEELQRLRRMHIPMSEIEAREEALRAEARQEAERGLREFLVLREIARAEKVEVTDEDFVEEAEAISRRTGTEVAAVRSFMDKEEHKDDYTERLLRRKALAFVMQHAQITNKELPHEEDEAQDGQA